MARLECISPRYSANRRVAPKIRGSSPQLFQTRSYGSAAITLGNSIEREGKTPAGVFEQTSSDSNVLLLDTLDLTATIVPKIPSQGGTMCPFFAFGGLIMRNSSLPGCLAGSWGLEAQAGPGEGAQLYRARERRARGGARSGGPDRGGAAAGVRV